MSAGTGATNRAQGTTQLFYSVNTFHDWLEAAPIGFDPASHNFEGADFVLAESQDGGGFNNANMNTPADGESPRMQMYLYRATTAGAQTATVSSADDAGIVYHEYTHGLSNRLVNNGLGNSLLAKQSRAMGEGWSDFFATDFLVEKGFEPDTAADGELLHGDYTSNDTINAGRTQALDCPVGSANATRCPGTPSAGTGGYTFGDVGRILSYNNDPQYPLFEEHAEGELWAQILWDLRKVIGGSATRRLAAEAMRLSPVPPSMVDERDAILLADAATGGTFHDQIWAVFATRGMGVGASTPGPGSTRVVESFAVPTEVAKVGKPIVTDPPPLGDGDGALEPGETARVRIPLRNLTPAALAVTSARLSATAPAVVGVPTVDYGSIGSEQTANPVASFAVTIPAGATCGAALPVTLKVNDATALALTLPVGAKEQKSTYAATDLPKTISDFNLTGASSSITIPTVQAVDVIKVHVKLAHNFIGDLSGRLTAPGGTAALLFERPGYPFIGTQADNMDIVLDDDAVASIQDRPFEQPTITTGPFRPNELLSKFSGGALNGGWTLRVLDLNNQYNNTGGTLQEFSITAFDATCNTNVAQLPEATSAAATGVTGTGATVNGSVDPNGSATDYAFQYGTTTDSASRPRPRAPAAAPLRPPSPRRSAVWPRARPITTGRSRCATTRWLPQAPTSRLSLRGWRRRRRV